MTQRVTQAPPDSPDLTRSAVARSRASRILAASGMLPALIVLILIGTALSPSFLTATNFSNVLRLGAVIGLLAIGQTLVILSGGGGIDLSVAAVAAASAIVGAQYQGYGLPAMIVASLVAGGFFGLINGLGVALAGLQPFIVTLATMTIARGVGFELTNAQPLYLSAPGLETLSRGAPLGIPVPIIILGLAVIVGQILLSRTTFGRSLYAVGGNEEAAFGAGINVRAYRIGVYVISGLLAALAGIIGEAQLNTADPNFANGYELSAIAAVVVGGALLSGGKGTIVGTLIGVVIMALVSNLLNLLNVNPWTNLMVTGLIIVVVVALNRPRGTRTRKSAVLSTLPLFGAFLLGAIILYGILK
ncbi:ribose ABC transporter permease (plasmid) [Cryobacterium arcticum]|uniref:Ribose ABC transporter permease n=2 Tax=Cryobacterium arcticum TaxID=670052 RepID=A0A1B1BQJ0_9MICO|nr:ribose ABC transporter permease [Cryobacterium arcticum]